MQFVEALEADGINHVALHPQLFVAIGLKWVYAKQVMPVVLDLRRGRGDGHNGTEFALVGGCRGYHHHLADLEHLRGYKAAGEVTKQHVALFGVIVESQSSIPHKKQNRPKAASFDTQWSLHRPFCAAGSTPKRIQTPASLRW